MYRMIWKKQSLWKYFWYQVSQRCCVSLNIFPQSWGSFSFSWSELRLVLRSRGSSMSSLASFFGGSSKWREGSDSSLAASLWSSAELETLLEGEHLWGRIATWPSLTILTILTSRPSSTVVTSTLYSNFPFTWRRRQHLISRAEKKFDS